MNGVRFMISEEGLALGSGTRLDYSELLCGRSFITVKGTEKASDIDIRRGTESAPLTSLSKELYTFSVGYYSKSKECLKFVKVLPDPLPQFTF